MKIISCSVLIFLLALSWHANAQVVDNAELKTMAEADQMARSTAKINWLVLNKEDSLRRKRVFELIKSDQVKTAKDHLNAGIIFQHGNDTLASSMAVKSFKTAIELDSTLNKWWYAAAVDRDLMRRNKPQIYGTQFLKNKEGKWVRYKIDAKEISDQERKRYSVETLGEQEQKERLMNLKSVSAYYAETKSVNETISQVKDQVKRGSLSAYNASEGAINDFGYELMNKNLNTDALKIFKLNTKLYPKSFNTFDSYGEALMKVGRKQEAIRAFKKSLKLNPENDNAKQVLREADK